MAIQKIVTDDALSAFASDVKAAIANVSSPLVYKGTLGTGGTISTLPAASASNNGFAYVVITAGTYQGVVCAVGDVIASNGTAWNIIPQANSAETLPITNGSAVNTKEYIDTKTTLVKSASGSLIHITDGGDNIPMKSLESEIVAVESGSGTKSPTNPYTISGFDNGVVSVYAKYHRIIASTLTPQTQSGITVTPFADGHFEISGTATANITLYFNIPTFTIYGEDTRTLNFNNDFANFDVSISFIKDSTVIDSWSMNSLNRTYTNYNALANKECNVLSVTVSNGVSVSGSFKVEFLVTNSGTAYTFTFGQTVYGGRLIYENGQWSIEATFAEIDMSTLNYEYVSPLATQGIFPFTISDRKIGGDYISEQYVTLKNKSAWLPQDDFSIISISDLLGMRVKNSNCTTVAQIQSATSGCHLIYELATPVIIPITSSTRVKTILGENNIFSNCGDTAIEYFTSSADGLAALIEVLSNS